MVLNTERHFTFRKKNKRN